MQTTIDLQIPDVERMAQLIHDVPDFPKPGIVFKDITPLLACPAGLSMAVEFLTQPFRHQRIDIVVGAESRGFIFGTAVARNLSAGFVPIRKPGKLPGKTMRVEYELEYGHDSLEIIDGAIKPGMKVLMIDDLLATGGTMRACCELVEEFDVQIVAVAFLIELCFLKGRDRISKYPIHSVIKFES